MMRIKVCGMTQEEQVLQLPSLGVEFAGFIFYAKSPRYVFRHMTTTQIRKINTINKVGVFVNAPMEDVLQIVDDCRLHMVQLHGDETPRYCEKIADYISVVKAFRVGDTHNIEWMARDYRDSCDMYLFDTLGSGYGGTGKKFDWTRMEKAQMGKPFFLSGGIEPGDEAALKTFAATPVAKDLFAIDVNSKFETSAGVKNMAMVEEFVKGIK
jgi:phosphoribosylanthranilate isomerase